MVGNKLFTRISSQVDGEMYRSCSNAVAKTFLRRQSGLLVATCSGLYLVPL